MCQGTHAGDERIHKLRWHCRRGMKELDLLLGSFVDKHCEELGKGAFPVFEEFLDEEDDEIWSWLQLTRRPDRRDYREQIKAILSAS
jgi:antitoxin CptB